MAIHHAVLALLADGPSYGYELKARFEDTVGPGWGEFNIGHLYQVLDRLVRDELVTRRTVAQSDRPDKRVYRLTEPGRKELQLWMESPYVRQGGYRDDFFMKLYAAARIGEERIGTVAMIQRAALMEELRELSELRARHRTEALASLLLDGAIAHTEATLRVLDRVEEVASALVEQVQSIDAASHHEAVSEPPESGVTRRDQAG